MPTIGSSQLPPPKDWDEFEDMCADLFSREWSDPYVVRHGRKGQRQNGVDIHGKPKDGGHAGVQCKGKRIWPPNPLTIEEIDTEVEKALSFSPSLTEFIIATTAQDDAFIQEHVRMITKRHHKEGLFSVHVLGWRELLRRLDNYTDLIEKYYSYINLNAIRDEIKAIPQITVDLLSEKRKIPLDLIDKEINKRLFELRKKRYFGGFDRIKHAKDFANQILKGELKNGSPGVKSKALAWCARILSIKDTIFAEEILTYASQLEKNDEVAIASGFISASRGEQDYAMKKLNNINSPSSRSAAFIIIKNRQGGQKAFEWLKRARLCFDDLDPDGKFIFLDQCIVSGNWDKLLECANILKDEDFSHTPMLFFSAAIANIVHAVPSDFRHFITKQVPFELIAFPLASDNRGLSFIRNARNFFNKFTEAAESLYLRENAYIASDFTLWLELRDPEQREEAKKKLRDSLRDQAHFLRRVNFALQFGIELDLKTVNQEIERQNALTGGNSIDAAFARFSLAFVQKTPEDIAGYINQYRNELSRHINKTSLGGIEAEMLARSGRIADAEECLKTLEKDGLDKQSLAELNKIISVAISDDPIKECMDEFQKESSLLNLTNLVHLLEEYKDWKRLCQFGAQLFDRTHSLQDAERLAFALHNSMNYSALGELLRNNNVLVKQSLLLQALWCRAFFREGKINEAKKCLDELREKRDDPNDRLLAVNIAILSGNWESLARIVEEDWEKRDSRSALELLHAAEIAHQIGLHRVKALVNAAVEKGEQDANVYLHAYMIATREGWEEIPEVFGWFSKAIEYSGDEGPVKQMSLKDISKLNPDWDRKVKDAVKQLKIGELPLFLASRIVNRSLVDLFLSPALSNLNETDPRRRATIYAYSGAIHSLLKEIKTVGIDATALLTFTLLDILQEVINYFDSIVIHHYTLGWLFEEKQNAQFHQPSRISDAKELRELIDEGVLQPFVSTAKVDTDLAVEVGEELASLIAEAESEIEGDERQRLVVSPYPVHRIDSMLDEEADLGDHKNCICSCTALIEKLKQRGQLTVIEEKKALVYVSMHEKRWHGEPVINDGAVLYIDNITIDYLQHLKLLRKLKAAGLTAIVSPLLLKETSTIIRYDNILSDVKQKIEVLRNTLSRGINSGKVTLGTLPTMKGNETPEYRLHPSANILDMAGLTDAIVVDDRSINRFINIKTNAETRPIITSCEILEMLYSDGKIDFNTLLEKRTMLRRAGLILMPLDLKELQHHMSATSTEGGVLSETAELKAIRENILQTRMTGVLVLPNEANWLSNIFHVVIDVLKSQWTPEIPDITARARSNWLIQFIDFRGWSPSFGKSANGIYAVQTYSLQILQLLTPPFHKADQVKKRYSQWLDDTIIERLKVEEPEIFSMIVKYTRKFIDEFVDKNIGKEP